MTEENAALTEDVTLDSDLDQDSGQASAEVEPTESAPVQAESKVDDSVQQRINKEVSRRHTEKRRADAAEAELAELRAKAPVTVSNAPTLEEHDHDEVAFNAANIKFRVDQAVNARMSEAQVAANTAKAQEAGKNYDNLVNDLGRDDFHEVAGKIPVLDQSLVSELMSTKEGVEMIYHLGSHLDVADKIANMSPLQAMGELGRISASMSAKAEPKVSAAPDPIAPLSSGGALSKDGGPDGAIYE